MKEIFWFRDAGMRRRSGRRRCRMRPLVAILGTTFALGVCAEAPPTTTRTSVATVQGRPVATELPQEVKRLIDAATRPPEEKPAPEGQSPPPELATSTTPPAPLVPQAEGTPLPSRDPRIAERWPPEIKQLVDNMLTLYPKSPEESPPSVKEVERKVGITLTERPLTEAEHFFWSRRFVISGTRYMNPALQQFGLGEYYGISRARDGDGMRQYLRLVTSPKETGFCLDPYELAVYTGSTFVNGDTSVHVAIRQWPPAYVWGMFRWSNTSRYVGQGFSIHVGQGRDPATHEVINTGCVAHIMVGGRYQEEK